MINEIRRENPSKCGDMFGGAANIQHLRLFLLVMEGKKFAADLNLLSPRRRRLRPPGGLVNFPPNKQLAGEPISKLPAFREPSQSARADREGSNIFGEMFGDFSDVVVFGWAFGGLRKDFWKGEPRGLFSRIIPRRRRAR